jgi:hypothetical protein
MAVSTKVVLLIGEQNMIFLCDRPVFQITSVFRGFLLENQSMDDWFCHAIGKFSEYLTDNSAEDKNDRLLFVNIDGDSRLECFDYCAIFGDSQSFLVGSLFDSIYRAIDRFPGISVAPGYIGRSHYGRN